MQGRRITLKDIAQKAGVDRSTVSLAMKGQGRISEVTRERIRKIARELNYRPDPALAALVAYSKQVSIPTYHDTLAFLIRDPKPAQYMKREYIKSVFTAARAKAAQAGYKLEEFWLGESNFNNRRASDILYHRNIRGLIIPPLPKSRGHLSLDWSRFCVVAMGYSLLRPQVHRVCSHQYRSVIMGMKKLKELGYRRVGMYISENQNARVDHNWAAGFYVGQYFFKTADRIPVCMIARAREDHDFQVFRAWFERHQPDAVIGNRSRIVEWLQSMDLRVPDHVGYMHLDCYILPSELSGIDQQWGKIGETATDYLITLLHKNETGIPATPIHLLIEGKWHEGKTTRLARASVVEVESFGR